METFIQKTSSFITGLIISWIASSGAKKRELINDAKVENSSVKIQHIKHKNFVWAGNKDFPDDGDDDYFSPSKWYRN